jgi:Putative quorum-sensing-regulated virulence factor
MDRMPFGQYKGKRFSQIPVDYLAWLLTCDLWGPLRARVEQEWACRHEGHRDGRHAHGSRRDPPPPLPPAQDIRPIVEELVTAGYKSLALKHHPDRGGDTAQMQRVNKAMEFLRRWLR